MDLAINQFDVNMSWYGGSLSAGPLRLRAWIWPLINLMLDIGYVWQISLRRILWGFEHRFGHGLGTRLKCQHSWVYLIIDLLRASKVISHYHPEIIFRRATSWCHFTLVVKGYKAVPMSNKQQVFLQQGHYFGMLWGYGIEPQDSASRTFNLVYLCGVLWR